MFTAVNWRFFFAHILALLLFLSISPFVKPDRLPVLPSALLTVVFFAVGLAAIVLVTLAFIPPPLVGKLLGATGNAWMYALAGAAAAWWLAPAVASVWYRASWRPLTDLTFRYVGFLLRPILPNLVMDRARLTMGAGDFVVEIGNPCSGFEGLGLILAFSIAWLFFFRREIRFPRALLLIPAALVAIWALNGFRIAALIMIGFHGAPVMALNGFHSQAGWIALSAVTLGFAALVRDSQWLAIESAGERAPAISARNPTAAYLAPFMAILAASLIAHAASAGFEWLYPLRFLAAGVTLWILRHSYSGLDWKFGWFGPTIGVAVFALWIVPELNGSAVGTPAALVAVSPGLRLAWIALRSAAAVITVPLAEELAFRGFLIRRLVAADFEAIPLNHFGWLPLVFSSAAFGLLHGERWLLGMMAGLAYALAMRRQGRIGEAVAAHATTNALLAGYVLLFHHWRLW